MINTKELLLQLEKEKHKLQEAEKRYILLQEQIGQLRRRVAANEIGVKGAIADAEDHIKSLKNRLTKSGDSPVIIEKLLQEARQNSDNHIEGLKKKLNNLKEELKSLTEEIKNIEHTIDGTKKDIHILNERITTITPPPKDEVREEGKLTEQFNKNNEEAFYKQGVVTKKQASKAEGKQRSEESATTLLKEVLNGPKVKDLQLPKGVTVNERLKNTPLREVYNSPQWLNNVFEKGEEELKTLYKQQYGDDLEVPSFEISQIDRLYDEYKKTTTSTKSSNAIFIVEGVDALELSSNPAATDGIVQVASQFNALESQTTEKSSLAKYYDDHTQGPRAVMPCAHALIKRDLMNYDAFSHIIPDKATRQKFIKDGYVQWGEHPEEFKVLLGENGEKVKNLLILPMWAKPELGGEPVLQCFTAAPPTSRYENRGNKETQKEIARMLVVQQYEALAKMAVIKARQTNKMVPLHLTLVGGGAFNNDPQILQEALSKVREIVKNENIDVYVHAFRLNDKLTQEQLKYLLADNIPVMGKSEFLNRKNESLGKEVSEPYTQELEFESPKDSDDVASEQRKKLVEEINERNEVAFQRRLDRLSEYLGENKVTKEEADIAWEELQKKREEEKIVENKSSEEYYNQGLEFERNKDFEKAFNAYQRAANKGFTKAKTNLGLLFLHGQGTVQDKKQAYEYFLSAASEGHVRAMYNVATMLKHGDGIPKNHIEALNWYQKAADHGDSKAKEEYEKLSTLIDAENKGENPAKSKKQSNIFQRAWAFLSEPNLFERIKIAFSELKMKIVNKFSKKANEIPDNEPASIAIKKEKSKAMTKEVKKQKSNTSKNMLTGYENKNKENSQEVTPNVIQNTEEIKEKPNNPKRK